jgi:glycosyltransferase involved in cell wall biosynthesis
LRVLFLTQTYPRFVGDTSGPFIRDLARGLSRAGDAVTVLTPHTAGVDSQWDDQGVAVRTFRYAPERMEVLGYSRSLEKDESIRPAAGLVAPLYLRAARRAAREALREEPFDLLHAHWVVPNALAAWPLSARVPVAVGLHGSDVFLAERRGVRLWVRRALGRARLLTGCSPELVERVCRIGFDAGRAHVIPYGVDTGVFRPGPTRHRDWRAELAIPADAPVLLTVGRMVTKKGFHVLIDALPAVLEKVPELYVVLAGGGDRLDEFRRRLTRWSDRVHLPGAVLRDALPDLYRAGDFFVLPAVHDRRGNVDGLPNVILEAIASGLPVVASEISGIPLAITSGETGILVPEQDVGALTEALTHLATDDEARRRMGVAARARAQRDLTWDAIAARYRAAYHTVLGESAGTSS